jgi:hypothetical protein
MQLKSKRDFCSWRLGLLDTWESLGTPKPPTVILLRFCISRLMERKRKLLDSESTRQLQH